MPAAAAKKLPTLKQLTVRLKDVQMSLEEVFEYVDVYNDEATLSDIELRLTRVDELWESFTETLIDLRAHDDFTSETYGYDKERREYSSHYYRVKSFLMERLKEKHEPQNLEQSARVGDISSHGITDHVRLPQIRLQVFSGEIDDWLSFRDLFTSLIHCKVELPDVEKFHYLKGCLQGEPRNLIDGLNISNANYKIAWEMLLKRYDNSKLLRKRQVQALFKLPVLSKESTLELNSLLENFEKTMQTLDQIIEPVDYKNLLLVNILSMRLDAVTRRSWEEFSAGKEEDTIEDLLTFLHQRVRVLQALPTKAERVDSKAVQPSFKQHSTRGNCNSVQMLTSRCICCKENHMLFQCPSFQMLSVSQRDSFLKTHALCRNCFKIGHQAKDCQSRYSCRKCKARHHTLVCFKTERNTQGTCDTTNSNKATTVEPSTSLRKSNIEAANLAATGFRVSATGCRATSSALLATAVVLIEDDSGNRYPARALLDSGSESNFIAERLSKLLKGTREKVDISVLGVGQSETKVRSRIEVTVKSRTSDFSQRMKFLVLRKVTANIPSVSINTKEWSFPNGIELADPAFFQSNAVDMVLGIDYFFEIFQTGRRMSLGNQLPTLYDSVFGWVVCGNFGDPGTRISIKCNVSTTKSLEALVAKFWACEEIELARVNSKEEMRCEEIFQRTVARGEDGRYTVRLPKNEINVQRLGESRDIALKRLHSTERRLARDANLRQQYVQFMAEYLNLGHMCRIQTNTATSSIQRCYLPHHPVLKESSSTTKLRVVFDASCKTSSGVSLNDALLVGPVIQEDLRSIIMRCRMKRVMLVSDVEKMFRQINISQDDRQLQCILWRTSPTEEVQCYELNTVTYGTKPAPFLATRVLKQLAMDERERFPLAASCVLEDIYMDDVFTGTDNIDDAIKLRIELQQLMASGGFRLRKWASNYPMVLHGLTEKELAIDNTVDFDLNTDTSVKGLGLIWYPSLDTLAFGFTISPLLQNTEITKRSILSTVAALFDPLGLLGPAITSAKIFLQCIWTLRDQYGKCYDWDQPLPQTVGESWQKYHAELQTLMTVRVDRCVVVANVKLLEIHCFSDASQKAYGACLYLKSVAQDGSVQVKLLASKSKVAPLKTQTIPRLELCGALIAAQLFQKVKDAIRFQGHTFFWTDSSCVLRWLDSEPINWNVYVANRVTKIQGITEGNTWRHVPGPDNPADLISRGISPKDIVDNRLWWQGPTWLQGDEEHWPVLRESNLNQGEAERRKTVTCNVADHGEEFNEWYLSKFSSYMDLVRKTAYWLRLIKILSTRKGESKTPYSFLSTAELNEAETVLLRRIQRECFEREWTALSKKEAVSRGSRLRWFNPYLGEDQLIRVGGRLSNSLETIERKHPVVLPAQHRLTRMIIRHYHEKLLHAGPQLLLGVLRLRFWPLGGRNVARHIVHQCSKCFRVKPTPMQQQMGDLPASRVTVTRPFSRVGVDYFGPVFIRPAPRRTAVKAYVALFVCMCTKAVHLELVSDLSTERFLQALRRFVSRRGKCTDIFSDNGTNFVGARNKLGELFKMLRDKHHQDAVTKACAADGIQWHFNPPSAPHFGGLWEAAVRSAKVHLLRVVGDTVMSTEDFHTLLIQVEGCLNSRPLTCLSDDPTDLEPLTPGHFLIGSSLQALPEISLDGIPYNRLNQFQAIQRRLQDFWMRWRREYLSQLQGRTKRWKPSIPVKIGRLVVIVDDNLPPTKWRMGRICEVHPGNDGVVRVVTLRTSSGLLKRPVEKLCLLPEQEDNKDESNANV